MSCVPTSSDVTSGLLARGAENQFCFANRLSVPVFRLHMLKLTIYMMRSVQEVA